MEIKKIIWNWKVLFLLFFLLISLLAIKPNPFAKGVVITKITEGSNVQLQGIKTGEIILEFNKQKITNLDDYSKVINELSKEESKIEIVTNKNNYIFLNSGNLGINVKSVEKSNIQKGLDLAGGTRVLLEPVSDKEISDQDITNLIQILKTRLDVYGLSDLTIAETKDLFGNKYISVEISGASEEEVQELIAKQGKFEAKIGDDVVFRGEKEDVRRVCKDDGTCSGVRDCYKVEGGYNCKFEFAITLSNDAAKRHAEITKKLDVNVSGQGSNYLDKKLDLFLDSSLVDSLLISEDLKGRETTDIAVSGPGFGNSEAEALEDSIKNMNKLQTILMVGSLPLDVNIVKMDTISPVLGSEFIKNIIQVCLIAILSVVLVVGIRYRNVKIIIPMIITLLSEIFIILGFAAFIKWRLDLVAIAGIIASVGTGVDDQIIITDEVSGKEKAVYNWKEKIKRAFFIILVAYFATVAAMLPLMWAGAGLLKGFAITTIVGVTSGVFVTRPAFSVMIENLLK